MKSVGEAMAIGRTFKEALQKSVRSLEIGRDGLGPLERDEDGHYKGYEPTVELHDLLREPNRDRLFAVYEALARGDSQTLVSQLTGYDPWFVAQMGEIIAFEQSLDHLNAATLRRAKRLGFSDGQLARIGKREEVRRHAGHGRQRRDARPRCAVKESLTEQTSAPCAMNLGVLPTYHQVDTCAAEFEAFTPYLYSSYESESEAPPTDRQEDHHPGRRSQPHWPGHRV